MRHTAPPSPRRTAREIGAGLLATISLVAAVVGLPVLLYVVTGVPIPHHAPSPGQITHALSSRDNGQLFLSALLVIAWAGWAVFTLSVVVEAAAVIRGRAAIRLPGCSFSQQLASALVAAAVVLIVATPAPPNGVASRDTAALLPLLTGNPVIVTANADPTFPAHGHPNGVAPHNAHRAPSVGAETLPSCTVQRRDTLWAIAERHLRDPERWQEIARLNYDRPQPDGRTLTDSHWIYPGWHLLLPADATGVPGPQPETDPAGHEPTKRATTHVPPAPARQGHANPSTPPSPVRHQPDRPKNTITPVQSPAVELDSGSRLAAAFAAGILAALATGRLRRRRRYRPQPPAPGCVLDGPPTPRALRDLLAATRGGHDEAEQSGHEPTSAPAPPVSQPVHPADPDVIDVGDRHGQPVPLALTGWKGLGLRGPGAEPTARAWLADLLNRAGPYGAEILGPAALLDRLFPGVPALPGLRPVADVDCALRELEAETLRRTRLLDTADQPDATSYRRAHPEDPLPVLIAIIDTIAPADLGRWRATLDAGQRLAIEAMVLGTNAGTDETSTAMLDVGTDGAVHAAHPQGLARTLADARLFSMQADDAAQLLGPIAALHLQVDEEPSATIDLTRAGGATHADPGSQARAESSPNQMAADRSHPATTSEGTSWPAPPAPTSGAAVISVQMLGPLRIRAWGQEISTGLRGSARELLAWYLLHPDGATADAAIDALWPDAPIDRGPQRFWTALGNLRTRLRGPDQQHIDVLAKTGDIYTPQPDMLDVDLWRFQNELHNATRADDEDATLAALRQATTLYRGDVATPADYLWIEPAREDLHRRALDAHARLAELQAAAGHIEGAIETLEHAIILDPVAEEMYRRLITLLARAGRSDAINRTWIQLQARLADLDLDPEPETVRLVRRATAERAERQLSRP